MLFDIFNETAVSALFFNSTKNLKFGNNVVSDIWCFGEFKLTKFVTAKYYFYSKTNLNLGIGTL